MGLRQQLDDDVKAALLGGDKLRVDTLRGLKTVILYADVATKSRDTGGIDDDAIEALLFKEAKKRQESADLYVQGGNQTMADKEMAEKALIETYLPAQLDEAVGRPPQRREQQQERELADEIPTRQTRSRSMSTSTRQAVTSRAAIRSTT